jgi:heat-inducible transcriptional repressor
VIVVVITSAGGVTKRVVELEQPVDAGLVDWARAYLEEQVIGLRLGSVTLRRRLEDPGLAPAELAFLARLRPAFVDAIADEGPQLFVGGAAGLLGDARGAELEACQHLLDVLERRAAVLELLSDALDPRRTVVRVGPEVDGGQLHDVSYVGASYGFAQRPVGSVALLGPLRMDYQKAIRAVRAAAFELSRLVEDVYEDE